MKKILLTIVVLTSFYQADATIWRVNNTTGVDADFANIDVAVNAASAGDTIYVEPSTNLHMSSVILTKKIILIGNGYFISGNGNFPLNNSGLQADTNQVNFGANYTFREIVFNPGSSGSVIMGFKFENTTLYVRDSLITIKRNLLKNSNISISNKTLPSATPLALHSLDIRQNLFMGGSIVEFSGYFDGSTGFPNISIQNNIFIGNAVTLPVGMGGFIQNNVFDGANLNAYGFQINNNIMINGGNFTANNSVYFNNISSSTEFGNANNNQQNVGNASLFTNLSNTLTETRYILNPTGPGIGAGFNSVDVGIFGGPDPYKLSGIPPVPTIYQFSAPATTTSNILPVTISTRSND